MSGIEFCKRIDSFLDKKGVTRAKMLKDIGLNKSSMIHWEDRGNIPSGDICLQLAKYFNTSVEYLITGKEGSGIKPEESDLIMKWESLTEEQKQYVMILVNGLYELHS